MREECYQLARMLHCQIAEAADRIAVHLSAGTQLMDHPGLCQFDYTLWDDVWQAVYADLRLIQVVGTELLK
jgi:hypothetical protein